MKRKLLLIVLAALLLLTLAACGCEHQWTEASCTQARTCSVCGQTEGAPKGHTWAAATCTDPKTCEVCALTEGEAKGHIWEAATCVVPQKCATCHTTQGEALSHDWEEATTETPKTCKNCQTTEGEKLDTDPRFTTEKTKHLHGKWYCDTTLTGEMMGIPGYFESLPVRLVYEFGNTGELGMSIELEDTFAFMDEMKRYTRDVLLASLEAEGIPADQADAAMKSVYGMTVDQYVDTYVETIDKDEFFAMFNFDGVYYVGSDKIHMALSWYDEFENSEYTLEEETLIIEADVLEEGGDPLQWKRLED